jgi:hypothetical protein
MECIVNMLAATDGDPALKASLEVVAERLGRDTAMTSFAPLSRGRPRTFFDTWWMPRERVSRMRHPPDPDTDP